jgi:deoxyribose-phosphate aldolase
VRLASVATAFPSGQAALDLRLAEAERAVGDGADEIDMVISRGAFLAGDEGGLVEEVSKCKEACGAAGLKVILETGELGTLDRVRRASLLAMSAGADMIKTSTGKVSPASTPSVAVAMAEAIRDFADATGRAVGLKVAGGIRGAKDAIRYLVIVHETLGPEWLTPERLRIGASSLLNDLLMQRDKQLSGAYADPDRYTRA